MLDYYLENKATGHIYRLIESMNGTYRIIDNNHTVMDSYKIVKEYKKLHNAIKYFEQLAGKSLIETKDMSQAHWR